MIPVDGERYRRFNVAPTTHIPVAVMNGEVHADDQIWGILPPWSKQRLINARVENLLAKSFFKGLMQKNRCLIPATGFFEWREENGKKQPYHFRLRDGEPFFFAGLWREAPEVPEFLIVTTEPNEVVAPFHDRMPAVMREEDLEDWLRLPAEEAFRRVLPFEASEMECYPVTPRMNSPKYEAEDCVEPIEVQGELF